MLDVNIPYNFGDPGPTVDLFTNNIINLEVKHQTTTEYLPGDGDGFVHIWFTRTGTGDPAQNCSMNWGINSLISLGDLHNNVFDLWPESDYATPTPETTWAPGIGALDFGLPSSGKVEWGGNDFAPKELLIPIYDDNVVEFNEDFEIELTNDGAVNCRMGESIPASSPSRSTIMISPPVRWNPRSTPIPSPPATLSLVPTPPSSAMAVTPDQQIIIGGAFTAYNAVLRNRIARVNFNGTIDKTFDPGNGADGLVTSLALQSDGAVVIGGDFLSVDGINRYHIARLLDSGKVDTSFNPGWC